MGEQDHTATTLDEDMNCRTEPPCRDFSLPCVDAKQPWQPSDVPVSVPRRSLAYWAPAPHTTRAVSTAILGFPFRHSPGPRCCLPSQQVQHQACCCL